MYKSVHFKEWLVTEEADSMAILKYLKQIEAAGFKLLTHQTASSIALKIIKGQDFQGYTDLPTTSIFMPSDDIARSQKSMAAFHSGSNNYAGNVHKGSDAILIMAIPMKIASKGLQFVDDYIKDLIMDGKLDKPKVPNQYMVGFWTADKNFYANGKFNPKGGILG